jgi:hypothetical protein
MVEVCEISRTYTGYKSKFYCCPKTVLRVLKVYGFGYD